MSVVSVKARSFILALFIRDDGERFLLGDNGYDFKDSQLHFAANTIENDEVMKQGADGVMVAGQVRRASVQSFDGFVGDATMAKETIEQMRRDFIAFFLKGHHYRVIYVDCNRNAWQRKGGYLVDAPEVKELWQIHPEYHVGLNFEDVNYYSYDENADGEEILSNLIDVPVSTAASGGLVWDEDGAVSEDAEVEYDTETAGATGKAIAISDAAEAPLSAFKLDGETSQNGTPTPDAPVAVNTTTGENVVKITGKNLYDGSISETGKRLSTSTGGSYTDANYDISSYIPVQPNTTYTINTQGRIFCDEYTDSKAFIVGHVQTYGSTDPITITTASTACYIRFDFPTGNNIVSQLELGSTATTFEPYQGQSYEVNLGKNLFDKDTMTLSNVSINPNINSANGFTSVYIPCEPNTIYTVQKAQETTRFYVVTTEEIPAPGVQGTAISSSTSGTVKTFTTGASARYIAVMVRSTSDTLTESEVVAGIQIEKGSQATSYAAYFEPIELCKIGEYQDYIYKNEDEWYVHKEVGKYTFDGSENWARSGRTSASVFVATVNISSMIEWKMGDGYKAAAKSDLFIAGATNAIGHFDLYNGTNFYTSIALMFDITTIPDITAAKAWITANTPSVYAILATPTDTEITNADLIAQLNALLTTARTYAGTNNIFTITPNEQGTLEISYYTKYQPVVVSGGYVWEAGGAGGPTVIINNSIDSVSPVWTIYGPTTNPQLENATTGETIEYVGTIAQGQTLTIDMGEQTASLDGLNVISNLVGDFVSLAPGANRLIYSVSGDAGASEIGWSEIVG